MFLATDHPAFKNVTVITAHSSEAASVKVSHPMHTVFILHSCVGKKPLLFMTFLLLLLFKDNLLFLFSFTLKCPLTELILCALYMIKLPGMSVCF